jgi:hypothetical protein
MTGAVPGSASSDGLLTATIEGSRPLTGWDVVDPVDGPHRPESPSKVDHEAFYLYWRRRYHRLDYLYRIVKLLRSLASLGFETLRDAIDEGVTLDELVARVLPEDVAEGKVDSEARDDVRTMGTRPKEEQDQSLDRPLRDEVLLRLHALLNGADAVRDEFKHYKKRQFFRQIGRAELYAKKFIDLLNDIEADRALATRRREQYGKKSA